jgi:hypothetical protein
MSGHVPKFNLSIFESSHEVFCADTVFSAGEIIPAFDVGGGGYPRFANQ